MLENLGDKLKAARVNCGLTRKQVAELMGVGTASIGLYETGERLPSLPAIVKLATQYRVSVDYLLGCDARQADTLPLDGLADDQVRALRLTADCFRNLNR
ncbi:MAG: helix-turn-helix domain-containing protein [Butyrivibrio sp.]|nr:helix-turn-helix domain-containing protein [Butyrivibrio sp.]